MISKKENLLRTIKRTNPQWVPYRYDGSMTTLRPKICVKKEEGGKDDWGVMWLSTQDKEGCYTDGKPVTSIDLIDRFVSPITDWNFVTIELKNQVDNMKDKDTLIFSYCDFALFERAQFIIGLENLLISLIKNQKKVEKLLDIITDYHSQLTESMMLAGVDGIRFCDDWGMQSTMFIKPEMWRTFIKPRMKKLYNIVKKYNGFIWQHSCGHVSEIIPDLLEMGIHIIDPCQPRSNNVIDWKLRFGKKLCFLGGLDTQGYLSFSNPEEVKIKVKEFIKIMSKGGGYIAAPSHTISIPDYNKNAIIEALNDINASLFSF